MLDREWETAGRLGEMHQGRRSLRLEVEADGDIKIYIEFDGVPIHDEDGNEAYVEFCTTSGGGGRSPHTRRALSALFIAMLKDGAEKPEGLPPYPVGLDQAMKVQYKKHTGRTYK